ncbi:hypothetical protein EVAR_19379_1 [Eumeta japonica]|uniref:Uncharacterized protein n=1 Tax=Eumeta variegata TaxID=151549 RepID=A0A4C1TRP6_EUMVA|nr:hypothetical protein EVAR_19379_1 [Eumeta japonica]
MKRAKYHNSPLAERSGVQTSIELDPKKTFSRLNAPETVKSSSIMLPLKRLSGESINRGHRLCAILIEGCERSLRAGSTLAPAK